jgi:hypothetical protein
MPSFASGAVKRLWPVAQACYAAQLSDTALDWLVKGRVITRQQRSGD